MAIYGAEYKGNLAGNQEGAVIEFVVKDSTTITKGDFVKIAAGEVDIAVAGGKILGVAAATVVQPSGGVLTIPVIVDPTAIYHVDGDNAGTTLSARTHEGTYFDITGATGAMLVDTSTTDDNSGQLLCLKVDPTGRDASMGAYVIAESLLNGFTVDAAS